MIRLFFILSLVILSCGTLSAQTEVRSENTYVNRKYLRAVSAFQDGDYTSSLKYLNQALCKDSEFLDLYVLKYRIYKLEKDTLNQISCLSALLDKSPSFSPNSFYVIGELYFSLSRYEDALSSFKNFVKYVDVSNRKYDEAMTAIDNCNFALKSIMNASDVELSSFNALNLKYNDYWPYVNTFTQELFFTRMNTDSGSLDENVMAYNLIDSTFSSLPFNTSFNEGTSSVTADGCYHFFSSNNIKSLGSHDIFFVEKTADGWSEPINIGGPVNTVYWESQTSISPNGEVLYFASNRPGGHGGSDIYVSHLLRWTDRGRPVFSDPVNLSINTVHDDMAPYIYADNMTLYFSTKGRIGMGGFDVFKSTLIDGEFSDPKNLGYPINSNRNELGFTLSENGSMALFCSDRRADMNIYSYRLPQVLKQQSVINRYGGIYDEFGNPLEAKVVVTNNVNSSVSYTKGDCLMSLFLDVGFNYSINIIVDGYKMYSEDAFYQDSIKSCRIHKNVILGKSLIGDKMILNNVTFDFDSFVLKESSYKQLSLWIEYLRVNKLISVEIGGHTDSVGDSIYNMQLSIKRAKVIYDYIIFNGISKDRLVYKGYGNLVPLLPKDSKLDLFIDRRTEMKILYR